MIILLKFVCKIKAKIIKNKSITEDLNLRIGYLTAISKLINNYFCENKSNWISKLEVAINEAENHNPWFTKKNIHNVLKYWANKLNDKSLIEWTNKYNFHKTDSSVAIIMAGNFPLAGFHDFICVLLSGNKLIVKPSSDDKILICFFIDFLKDSFSELKDYIFISEGKLSDFEMVIATGSNNTFNYFEYYFRDKKSILRKNRNSIAILDGKETKVQLTSLARDIFQYFGLGCRNVSKIFIPVGYDLMKLKNYFKEFEDIIYHNKYSNNYNYHKTIKIMNNEKFIDNGYFMLVESDEFSPPISVVNYQYYSDIKEVQEIIEENQDRLQCVVSHCNIKKIVEFGETQNPKLYDYADNIDTFNFLLTK